MNADRNPVHQRESAFICLSRRAKGQLTSASTPIAGIYLHPTRVTRVAGIGCLLVAAWIAGVFGHCWLRWHARGEHIDVDLDGFVELQYGHLGDFDLVFGQLNRKFGRDMEQITRQTASGRFTLLEVRDLRIFDDDALLSTMEVHGCLDIGLDRLLVFELLAGSPKDLIDSQDCLGMFLCLKIVLSHVLVTEANACLHACEFDLKLGLGFVGDIHGVEVDVACDLAGGADDLLQWGLGLEREYIPIIVYIEGGAMATAIAGVFGLHHATTTWIAWILSLCMVIGLGKGDSGKHE